MHLAPLLIALSAPAQAADLQFGYSPTVDAGQKPWFSFTAPVAILHAQVVIDSSAGSTKIERSNIAANTTAKFEWPRDPGITQVTVHVLVEYADHMEEEFTVPLNYSYGGSLSVDLSRAKADVGDRTITVKTSAHVDSADIVAYGAHKATLDQRTVPLDAGPGEVVVPWVGDPGDVVLLDVTLHSGGAWAGFTYSPWFLDIPHEDVLFASDQSAIAPSEESKLDATLAQLRDVLDKYGEIVPVKLYIGGCTDTVGDAAHNQQLSQSRAKAIAGWLRAHGYDRPIYYHGFGEGWLAEGTGDGVDSQANRRAVYMVGANPPPGGSGVPAVSWTEL